MEWTVTAPILLHQKNYRFHPITNQHHEIIIKYCMSKDDAGLILYMQDMLQQLIIDKDIKISNLPIVDQLFLLIRLRSLCIGTRLDVVVEGDSKSKHRVSLIDIQKSINNVYLQPVCIEDSTTSVKVTVHYPNDWSSREDIDYIKNVIVDGKDVNYSDLTTTQKQQIIDHIDNAHLKQIHKQIKKLDESINNIVFVQLPGEEPDITISHEKFNQILRIIYSDTLNNFVELMYVFVKILNFTLTDVMKLTPSDTQLYYQMFIKETNEREKAQKQAQSQNSARNVPGPR